MTVNGRSLNGEAVGCPWVQGGGIIFVGKTKQAFAVYSITFGKLGGGQNEEYRIKVDAR